MVEKKRVAELYSLASQLAMHYPSKAITAYIFGMYHYLLGKWDLARKNFNKAIQLDRKQLQSWIMLGHSFAKQEESEQAMNVYRNCIQLFPNSYLPHLFIGMEYIRVNNLETAFLSLS